MANDETMHHQNSEHDSWPIFTVAGDDTSTGVTDLAYLLEKPAGAKGFIRVIDGHLAKGDGARWRIWGQNLTARTALPAMELAPILVRHLAKYGINCLRLHFMDLRWPNGILMRSAEPVPIRKTGETPIRIQSETTRALDPEALARLDYLVACCKKNGIYVDLNLNVARPFTEADGVVQAQWIGYAKAMTYFNPRLIALQKEYAAQLLTHVNPFTSSRYADEPAVALVELVNENSLLESWLCDRLRGEQTQPCGTWADIPPAYADELNQLWNGWLTRRYESQVVLSMAWQANLRDDERLDQRSVRRLRRDEFKSAAAQRFADETEFYAGIERAYFDEMSRYLREELGVKQIILGSSDHNQGLNNPCHLQNLAQLGITDGHFYWQHPEFGGKDWSLEDWRISNSAMVDALERNVIARLSRSKVRGLPYVVTETNCPFPNDFATGFISILGAYGCFQDWDGIFLYTYNESSSGDLLVDGTISSFFAIANDPGKMAETASAGLAFQRGDVQMAKACIQRFLTRAQMIESQRTVLGDAPYLAADLPGRSALLHRVEIADFDAEKAGFVPADVDFPTRKLISDTGELNWESGQVIVDTPRWQAIFGRAGESATTNLKVHPTTAYAGVQAISLQNAPIGQSSQILLVTTARVANTGMRWTDDERHSLGKEFGHAPTRIEPVRGKIILKGLKGAAQVTITALDGSGQAMGEPVGLSLTAEGREIVLDGLPASVWYLIEVIR